VTSYLPSVGENILSYGKVNYHLYKDCWDPVV
jgi:hypothetical protein